MKNRSYIIRNYRPEDFDTLVQLAADVGKKGRSWCTISPQEVIESLGRPHHAPEKNLFIAEEDRRIIGYVDVTPEPNIGRVVLNCIINLERLGEDVEMRLIEHAIERAVELRVKRVHVNIPQDNMNARKLLAKMGFRFIRRFLELRLDLSNGDVSNIDRISPRCHHLKRGEEDNLVQIQNRSFAGIWGFNPNTLEEIVYRIGLPGCAPEDIILAFDGENIMGYCWTRIYAGRDKVTQGGKGRIYMLGVDPGFRGMGVGREVLLAGLSYLKSKGVRIVELTVDSKNKAACALYRSKGFQVRTSSLWHEKALE